MKDSIISRITFGSAPDGADDAWHEEVDGTLHSWFESMRRCGQILGDSICGVQENVWTAYVRLPSRDALQRENSSRYALKHLHRLAGLFAREPETCLLAEGNSDWTSASWETSPWLVLLGSSVDGLGPVRASDFSCVPNYRLPLDADESERLSFWAHSREQHESIWFASNSLEIETYRALADPLSDLNLQAARLAWGVEKVVGRPVFTVLFRHYPLPDDKEENRLCPLCGGAWRVQDSEIPFRCEPCRLLCEIGPSEPENGWEWIGTWEARENSAQQPPTPASYVFAQLSRGSGEGYERLPDEAPPHAWALLEDCLRHDPRLDRQVESREWYYGSLILATRMPLNRVWRLLNEAAEEEWLILEVVGWLAGQKVPGAGEALIAEVATRQSWSDVLPHLQTTGEDEIAREACHALEQRFADVQQLAAVLPEAWSGNATLLKPLETHESAIIRDALAHVSVSFHAAKIQRQQHQEALSSKTLHELIESSQSLEDAFAAGREAAVKATKEAADWLMGQLSHAHPSRSVAALMAIRSIMTDALFEPLLSFFNEGLEQGTERAVRNRCAGALLAASPEKLLPVGRVWIRSPHPERVTLAHRILARLAERQDIPLLRELLTEGLRDEETHLYLVCGCLEALERFHGHGWIDEVAQAYRQMKYSYGRGLAAKALHSLCPERFREELAHACLHDCEPGTRELAKSCLETGESTKPKVLV